MSSRFFSNVNLLSVLPTLVLSIGVCGAAHAASGDGSARLAPPIQNYADQVLATPRSQDYYNSPLAAGTLTLQDVLEAHKPAPQKQNQPPVGTAPIALPAAPLLVPPTASNTASSAALMMSQGMKAVLQEVGKPTVAPVHVRVPISTDAVAQGSPVALTAPSVPPAATPILAPPQLPAAAPAVQYQPGQAPKSLTATQPLSSALAAVEAPSPAVAEVSTPVAANTAATPATPPAVAPIAEKSCDENVQKWEKTCDEAGYPSTFIGKIVGETRTSCTDGSLHDIWVTNSCVPPAATAPQKTNAVCGTASNNEFDEAPSAKLCAQGMASAVNGEGPWTWACSGINGGTAAACIAQKRVPSRDGSCGSANGAAVATKPSTHLCTIGLATTVKGSGPWTWTCEGSGKGNSESCIAPLATPAPVPTAAVTETVTPPASEPVAMPDEARTAALSHAAATSEKGELCGVAAETLAYEAPEKDLCRAGTASAINGDGPWTWSCTDNEGTSSTCKTLSLKDDAADVTAGDTQPPKSAPETPVTTTTAPSLAPVPSVQTKHSLALTPSAAPAPAAKISCGFSAALPARQAPVTGLCKKGASSPVRGAGPWHWTCGKGSVQVTCEAPKIIDASCGTTNGKALKAVPTSGLCSTGNASGVLGAGPWTWSCNGIAGGSSTSCAASLQTPSVRVNGTCGIADNTNVNEAPTTGLCASGTPSAVNTNDGSWTWSCSGLDNGSAASCSANKIAAPKPPGPTVNGLCGAANGAIATTRPSENLCAGGSVSTVVGNGPWNWDCVGENGGMTVSCTAPMEPPEPISGTCGSASGTPTSIRPQSGLCAAGISGAVNGTGPWTWTCSGVNGGSPASCIAPVTGKTGALPSLMTTTMDTTAPAPEAPRSSLVTPHMSASNSLSSPKLAPKTFASAPAPARIPSSALVTGNKTPETAPNLPEGVTPLQPPTLPTPLSTAPALQESFDAAESPHIANSRLTLDPALSVIPFSRDADNINEVAAGRLTKIAALLQEHPEVRVSLYAYADNKNITPRDARHLSLSRALVARDYLMSNNISQSRIDVHAEGANTARSPMDRIDVKVNN